MDKKQKMTKGMQRKASVSDGRFDAVHTDPRFQRFPRSQKHVEVDERFAGMFSDPKFQPSTSVDKRGRKVSGPGRQENMRKFYRLQDQAREDAVPARQLPLRATKLQTSLQSEHNLVQSEPLRPPASSSEEPGAEEEQAADRWARARGLTGAEASSSEEEEDTGVARQDLDSDREVDLNEFGVGAMAANPDEAIPDGSESSRLAILDLDWDRVRAVDILVVLRSFLRKGRSIKSVTIFPSDYGLERMRAEETMGPQLRESNKPPSYAPRGKADAEHRQSQAANKAPISQTSDDLDVLDGALGSDLSGSQSDLDLADDSDATGDSDELSDPGDELTQRRLAIYERSRLRYYYAVVVCDSIATGAHLYQECDGLEFERSANKLDLRYIPPEQTFEGREAREVATDMPAGYAAPDFTTKALQHSRVQLTWDADDEGRKKALSRRVNAEQLREDDFKAYLGSSSEEDGPEEGLSGKYQQLLEQGPDKKHLERTGAKTWAAAVSSDEGASPPNDEQAVQASKGTTAPKQRGRQDMDMQVTFTGGLEGLSNRLAERRKHKDTAASDTTWQSYLKRRSEKRRQAKLGGRRGAGSSDDELDDSGAEAAEARGDPFFKPEANPFSDPFFQDAGPSGDTAGHEEPHADARAADRQREDKRREATAKRQHQAELELLLMDDSALQDSTRLGLMAKGEPDAPGQKQKLSRKQRVRAKKAARALGRHAGSDEEDAAALTPAASSFQVDVQDPRFKNLFGSHHFALDPTDPRFGASAGSAAIFAEAKRRRSNGAPIVPGAPVPVDDASVGIDVPKGGMNYPNLHGMVAALKRKAAAPVKSSKNVARAKHRP